MSEPRAGLVDIRWDDPSAVYDWFVYGHVSDEEAIAAVREELEAEYEDDQRDDVPDLGECRHIFAMWVPATDSDGEPIEGQLSWEPYVEAGGDAFPVTVVQDLDEMVYRQKQKADQAAREVELRAMIARWLPEATDINPHGYPTDKGSVNFDLPGFEGKIWWDANRPNTLSGIRAHEVETWNRLYRGRDTAPGRTPKETT